MKNKVVLLVCLCLFVVSTNAFCTLQLIQVLKDGENNVDGLDNPRNILVSDALNKLFVTSADDNALAVFDIKEDFRLTFVQVFNNKQADIQGLEGATGIAPLDTNTLVVSGFYDHSLTVFSASEKDEIRLIQRIQGAKDPLQGSAIQGPWELVTLRQSKRLFVANYLGNAILTYRITRDPNQPLRRVKNPTAIDKYDFGHPVALAFSKANRNVFVLGYEGHQLAVLGLNQHHQLFLKQDLQLDDLFGCLKPQKVVINEHLNTIYIACADSASLIVLKRDIHGKYGLLQKITEQGAGVDSLKGASSLSISKNGQRLFAAGEQGQGLLEFKVNVQGELILMKRHVGKDFKLNQLSHISSIALVNNDQHLMVTQSRSDSLLVFGIKR